ncbi:hypothetical protein ACSBR2_029040 [Camellia fascicularis]
MPIDTTVAQDGSGNFTRIADAILAAPNYCKRGYYIKIKEGFYREHFRWKTKNKSYICWGWLEQDGDIRQQEQWWRFPTLGVNYIIKIEGQGFVAQDITFENTAGPYKNQAKIQHSSNAVFKVDFIFGNEAVFFQNSIINAKKPLNLQTNTIAAQKREHQNEKTGTIIQNCSIKAADDLCQQNFKIKTFLEWNGRSPDRVYYVEYKNKGPEPILEEEYHGLQKYWEVVFFARAVSLIVSGRSSGVLVTRAVCVMKAVPNSEAYSANRAKHEGRSEFEVFVMAKRDQARKVL